LPGPSKSFLPLPLKNQQSVIFIDIDIVQNKLSLKRAFNRLSFVLNESGRESACWDFTDIVKIFGTFITDAVGLPF
jgi:hypothetical protein